MADSGVEADFKPAGRPLDGYPSGMEPAAARKAASILINNLAVAAAHQIATTAKWVVSAIRRPEYDR